MTAIQSRTQDLIKRLSSVRCLELFRDYGLNLVEIPLEEAVVVPLLYCGVVGYSGRGIRGSLAIASSRSVLGASNPVTDEASRDWAGELANQLMGHVKSRLLAYGVEVYLSTPTVLRGEHLSLHPQTDARPILFTDPSRRGLVGLWIDVETAPDLSVAEVEDPARAGYEGGASLLF